MFISSDKHWQVTWPNVKTPLKTTHNVAVHFKCVLFIGVHVQNTAKLDRKNLDMTQTLS